MTNAPALIVRHNRFTLVIGLLLASLLVVGGIGMCSMLHEAHASLPLMLSPLSLVLVATILVKGVIDRWSPSAICLTVSAEGVTIPGVAVRPIPWSAIKRACADHQSLRPDHAAMPRQYLMLDIEAPETFGMQSGRAVRRPHRRAQASQVIVDLSELDAGTEAVIAAIAQFHPTMLVAEGAPDRALAIANDPTIRFPSAQDVVLAARRIGTLVVLLAAQRHEALPAIRAGWSRVIAGVHYQLRVLREGTRVVASRTVLPWLRNFHPALDRQH